MWPLGVVKRYGSAITHTVADDARLSVSSIPYTPSQRKSASRESETNVFVSFQSLTNSGLF